jgi:pilus assembly protein FimV
MIDFQIELPKASEEPVTTASPAAVATAGSGLDFKLDGLSLNLDSEPKSQASGGEKDGHWYDVQTKFDLAKAYQEMGDKDGAKEILQEVLKEGDAEQQAQAKALMDSLG